MILNDYGIRPKTLFWLSNREGIFPKPTDKYDWTNEGYKDVHGNTNVFVKGVSKATLGWDMTKHGDVDIRLFYYDLEPSSWVKCRWDPNDQSIPAFWRISWITGTQICYTTEALKFAQGGYLISIVCVQWAGGFACKTRFLAFSQQGMINHFGTFGHFFETALIIALAYIEPLNIGLGTRHVAAPHFAIPSFSFYALIIFYDETRRNLVRAGTIIEKDPKTGLETRKYVGWTVQNTYY
jgi:hypothetical protein